MSTSAPAQPEVLDCLFFDPLQAWFVASLRQRVQVTPALTGLQMCYYVGEHEITDAPENLIAVRPERLVEFLVHTRYRWPSQVLFPPAVRNPEMLMAQAHQVTALLEEAKAKRRQTSIEIASRYASRRPSPISAHAPLRVLAVTTRYTTVVQYAARALLDAFAELGHQVQFVIERSDKEDLNEVEIANTLENFDPHICLNINFSNNRFLPEDVRNVVWVQDPLESFLPQGTTIQWRANDLVYTAVGQYIKEISATGIAPERVQIQPFCIDREVFFLDEKDRQRSRENRVVFVGNAANFAFAGDANDRAMIDELNARLAAGAATPSDEVAAIGARYGISRYRSIFQLSYMVMRDHIVRWLCQIHGIHVDVYGRFWENDPVVAPCHRGVLPHGEAVAEVYRSAKYALVLHPFSVSTQRLAEVGACGCIPIVYDCRFQADPPHWEEFALYFRTPAELAECVRIERPIHPERFGEFFDYRNFARRILKDALRQAQDERA